MQEKGTTMHVLKPVTRERSARLPLTAADALHHFVGRVIAPDCDSWRVRDGARERLAQRALSCLVEPAPDDLVLGAALRDGPSYVLAVLARQAGEVRLQLDPRSQLTAADGELTLSAAAGIRLEAPALELSSQRLQVVAERGSLWIDSLALLSSFLRVDVSKAALVARALETFAESIATRAKRVWRHSSELEQVQAAELQLRVDGTLDVRGRDALLSAKQLFKLNGEQVHVG
jgi:uncharacterized protein DUF3540